MKKNSDNPSGLWAWFINFIYRKYGKFGIIVLIFIVLPFVLWWNWDDIQKKPFIKNPKDEISARDKTNSQVKRSQENKAVQIDKITVEKLIINNFPQKEPKTASYKPPENKEIHLKLPKNEYELIVTGRSRIDNRIIKPEESQNFRMELQGVDSYIKNIRIINRTTRESTLFDFTSGHLPKGIIFSRPTSANYPQAGECVLKQAGIGEPRFVSIDKDKYALYVERGSTNLLLNSGEPKSQYVSLRTGTYTFWFNGSGTVSLINSEEKTGWKVFSSRPNTFKIISENPVRFLIIPDGDIKCYQLEPGEEPTSYINTGNAMVSRVQETIYYNTNIFQE